MIQSFNNKWFYTELSSGDLVLSKYKVVTIHDTTFLIQLVLSGDNKTDGIYLIDNFKIDKVFNISSKKEDFFLKPISYDLLTLRISSNFEDILNVHELGDLNELEDIHQSILNGTIPNDLEQLHFAS